MVVTNKKVGPRLNISCVVCFGPVYLVYVARVFENGPGEVCKNQKGGFFKSDKAENRTNEKKGKEK